MFVLFHLSSLPFYPLPFPFFSFSLPSALYLFSPILSPLLPLEVGFPLNQLGVEGAPEALPAGSVHSRAVRKPLVAIILIILTSTEGVF